MITMARLLAVMPQARPQVAAAFVDPLNHAMARFGIDTPLRQAAFLAQVAHESGQLSHLVENLNYSAHGLLATFSRRFTSLEAAEYARQPARIANRVYANRMGNGDERSGEGWKFRGRGLIQLSGRRNYQACGDALGVDLVANPSLLESPKYAALSAAWFWAADGLNELADGGDIGKITRRVNGGTNGLAERAAFYRAALAEDAA